jgi:hypothetical protein
VTGDLRRGRDGQFDVIVGLESPVDGSTVVIIQVGVERSFYRALEDGGAVSSHSRLDRHRRQNDTVVRLPSRDGEILTVGTEGGAASPESRVESSRVVASRPREELERVRYSDI